MSFYDIYKSLDDKDLDYIIENTKADEIKDILEKDFIDKFDFLKLLSKEAKNHLEEMALRANYITLKHFGRAVLLYTPIYISNYCVNKCVYCSYNHENEIKRKKLNLEEIEKEAIEISKTGLRHILLLTGDSKKESPVSYIKDAVKILKKYFDAISIEVYALKEDEYKQLVDAGVSGLTIYQEVYNEEIYKKVHLKGPKSNYLNRLDAPERGCKAGMKFIGIGALLGLNDFRKEAFYTGLHCDYLQKKYPHIEYSVSAPRIRPHIGIFDLIDEVDDKDLVQIILAYRIYLKSVGITMSTREKQGFRDHLIPLGVTNISAGVKTSVNGHSNDDDKGEQQFEIADKRSVKEMKEAIKNMNYQPLMKNWMSI